MNALAQRLPLYAAALWWGSLTVIGFIAVPLLFANLPAPAMAGYVAARIFTAQSWVSVACCVVLLAASKPKFESNSTQAPATPSQAAIVFIVLGLLLALLLEYAVAPRIVMRQNLRLWHGLGTVMYFVQWLCAAAALWSRER
ncbi:MAG TPA: DUF4149 domain-containing protein [Burkholderiaceae bacterium]